ncbi:SDR family NAD(P)-dependent oxidoreductase [Thermodesulfobacteriota bacterium]
MKRPELTLENKIALITGASGGIGGAIAKVFGAAGAKVFLHGTSEEKLKKLSGELDAEGIPHAYMAIDINISGAAQELAEAVVKEMGTIDILVNSAGINRPQKPEEVTEENWDDVMNINLKALFFVSQAVGRIMIAKGGGKIVNISSQAGVVALPLRSAYCSSKGGVNQLTRTLALEWAEHNISVNAVAPTFVKTPFTDEMFKDEKFKQYVLDSIPMRRMATLEEVANTTLFFASDLADIVTGQILPVDGGWTIK